jgi:hypothetical protein
VSYHWTYSNQLILFGGTTLDETSPSGGPESIGEVLARSTLTSSFARAWWEDARKEAVSSQGEGAKRREILFAVCYAESYLLEWVRDEALGGDIAKLDRFLDEYEYEKKGSLLDKWKEVPKHLNERPYTEITYDPNYYGQGAAQRDAKKFRDLVTLRNALVHAGPSLHISTTQPAEAMRRASREFLARCVVAGWATDVAGKMVRHLHYAVGTPAPGYLIGT